MGINNCHTCADMDLESKIIPGTNVNIILKNHGIEELHKKWHLCKISWICFMVISYISH